MRELEFRAWSKLSGSFYFFDGIFNKRPTMDFFPGNASWLGEIEQYTGLKDRNGQKLFDGDIIETDDGKIAVVMYDDFNVPCLVRNDYPECLDFSQVGARGGFNRIKKIGNKRENPELLEVKND